MDNKKPIDTVAKLTNAVIEYTGSALGLFLKRQGKEDMAYKVITSSRKFGENAESGVHMAARKTNNIYSNVKENVKDIAMEKTVKSATEKVTDRVKTATKTVKDSVIEEAKNLYNSVKDVDTEKVNEELNNLKNIITEKANAISNSEAVKKVEEKIGQKLDVENVKNKIAQLVKIKMQNKGFNLDDVEIDHTNDPFYNPANFVEEDPEVASQWNYTQTPEHEINLDPFKDDQSDNK